MSIVLVGATSGSVTLQEPAVAGTTVLDLPATSGTILTTTGGVTPGTAGNVLTSNGTAWTSATPAIPTQKVINVQTVTNSTRASLAQTGSTPATLTTFTYNKQSASSSLIFIVMIPMDSSYSGACASDLTYGSSSAFGSLYFAFTGNNFVNVMQGQATLTGYTTTGSQTLTARYYGADNTGSAPATIVNPNGSDDSRMIQTVSTVTVIEYL
jgi:hypothetical protein